MRTSLALSCLVFAVAGCDDPADDTTAAEVVEPTGPTSESPESPSSGETRTLAFSNDGSSVEWTGSKVTGSHDGGFREFAGTLNVDGGGNVSQVRLTVQTASLFADNDDLAEHLKSDDFFGVEAHPTALFETSSISAGADGDATHTVTGNLTLHGETKAIRFPATIRTEGADVRAEAEFSIDRKDYGLTYPGLPDDLIRDNVVIRFNILARAAAAN